MPKPLSKEQEEEKVRIYNLQQKQRYNERMIRKYTRLELASTDNDNREYYKSKKMQWLTANKQFISSNSKYLREDTSFVLNTMVNLKEINKD